MLFFGILAKMLKLASCAPETWRSDTNWSSDGVGAAAPNDGEFSAEKFKTACMGAAAAIMLSSCLRP